MIQTHNWKPNQLFFFDREKNIQRWKKRQKKPIDSLPITLLRDTRVSVTFAGEKLANLSKAKSSIGLIREEGEGDQSDLDPERKRSGPKRRLTLGLAELDYEEEEDTQRFLFEEAKFSAPSLLAQIEKFLILLLKQRAKQKEELEQLNEEIEATYGSQWGQGLYEEGGSFLDIPDDLFNCLCYDFEQFAEGTVYVVRNWQTNVYRELAGGSYSLVDFQSVVSSPDMVTIRSPNEKHRLPLDEKERKSDLHRIIPASNDGKTVPSDVEMPPVTSVQRESKIVTSVGKPKSRLDKFKVPQEKDKVEKDKTPRSKHLEQHDSADAENVSVKAPESNLDSHSQASKRKDMLSVASAGHKSELAHHESSTYNQGFVPGSVINFSLTSKSCHDKGWVNVKSGVDDLEQKNLIEWLLIRLRQVIKKKEEEETKLKFFNDNKSLIQRYYGDSKREATIKYKQGVAFAKFLSQKKDDTTAQLFLTTLPDGSTCCFYPSGNVAVISVKCRPGNQSFYTMAYSDEPNSKMLASFTPQGRGCCNYSEKVIRILITSKEAIFNDENGKVVKKWKWAYGKMLSPEVVQLNDKISIRCVSQSNIMISVHINGEVAKFPVSPFSDAPQQEPEALGYLMTSEVFTSRTAAQSQQPRKKLTKEERKARAQKRENAKNNQLGLSDDSLAERIKDIEEKFPERKDVDLDAPYLLELHKIQRKVRNIIFEWMEHYRSAIGISRPSKVSLLLKKKGRISSASSLPESMPSFPKLSLSSFKRIPSAPPVPKSSTIITEPIAKENNKQGSLLEHPFETVISETANQVSDEIAPDISINVPQLQNVTEDGRQAASSPHIRSRSHTSESAKLFKTPRPLLLPKDGCPVALHWELLGCEETQCRCDKRRIPYIMDLEYDVFIKEQVPKTQLIVISIISSRFPRTPCDVMLDDLYFEKHKAQTLLCAQSQFDPYRLLRYDLATAAQDKGIPLLLRRHNVAPGMFLMYAGGKLLFADYIFNGYGNAKRDLLNQIMRTRKDSVATGFGLAQDFRFNTRPVGREPRTAWGSEVEVSLPFNDSTQSTNSYDFSGFPALNSHKSSFSYKEKQRRKTHTGLVTYNRISNMQY